MLYDVFSITYMNGGAITNLSGGAKVFTRGGGAITNQYQIFFLNFK